MTNQVIILFGPPGAGKGTQAELLSEKLGLYNFETSRIIGNKIADAASKDFIEVEGEKYFFKKEKEIADGGKLWDPPFVIHLIKEKVQELAEGGEGIVFSASPRTVYEAEHLIPLLEKLYEKKNIKIILLEIKPETTIYRNSNRKRCELMKHPILFNEETKNLTVCPLDGSKLFQREDDNVETAKIRINQYIERTLPITKYFKKNKFKVTEVNGEQSIANVFANILSSLK